MVNNKDDPRARAFTVIHELCHLVLEGNGMETGPQTEAICNEIAGDVLMPREALATAFRATRGAPLQPCGAARPSLHCDPLAAAVRLVRTGAISKTEAEAVLSEIQGRTPRNDSS